MKQVKVHFRSFAGGVKFVKIYNATIENCDKGVVIRYEETDDNGLTKTEVQIIDGDFVTVKRIGIFSNEMHFKLGCDFSGEYITPYGKGSVEAFTRELKIEWDGEYPTIYAKYKSSLMGEVTENEFYLKVKGVNK